MSDKVYKIFPTAMSITGEKKFLELFEGLPAHLTGISSLFLYNCFFSNKTFSSNVTLI